MYGSGISFGGLASGINSGQIIDQLVKLESLPIDKLQAEKKGEQEKLKAIGDFKTLVKDLQKQAKTLSTLSDFLTFTVTPSQEGVASFAATGSAAAGAHTLSVTKLAAIDRWAFNGVATSTADLATGAGQTVSFTVGGTAYSIDVAQDGSSLEDIAAAINQEAGADVTASVVNAGTETAPSWKLVLTSDESGSDHRITGIASTIGGLTIDATGPDASGTALSANNLVVGSNATAVIDGLTVERTSNDFNNVLPGVSITVQSADPATTIHFSVEADDTAIKKKLQGFVDAYNKVITFANDQSKYSKEEGPGGKLFGDSLLSSVRKSLTTALFDVPIATVQGDLEGYSTLGLVGIKTIDDGTLQIDSATLDDKLSENLESLANLFVDSDGFSNGGAAVNTPEYYVDVTPDSGLAATLDREIDRLFKTFTNSSGNVFKGIFDSRNEAINRKIKDIDKSIESKQYYIEQFQQNLIAKFAKLEDVLGGLNAQGAALQSALAKMI
jgi:flagellar hook-associated protein 2